MSYFWTTLSYLRSLAGPAIMLLYPLYASVQALESPSKVDDEQWLSYWILYSFLTLLEMVAEPILYWIPIWYDMKVVLAAWLVLPMFRGSAFIYVKFVRQRIRERGLSKVVEARGNGGGSSSSFPLKKSRSRFLGLVKSRKGEHEAC